MDDDRLKQGTAVFGKDYFRELLERVRSIRASERRIWQQITDIYAECSTDYDRNSPTTKDFYAMVQNRFHYAITGQTAAEIIYTKADHTKEHMGLTTWKISPKGRILKSDVSIAKNYLDEKQIRQLGAPVTSYFDYIENQIERQNPFTMEQFAASVNKFLTFNDYKILPDKGRISSAQAKAKAESEYDIFNRTQRIDSDFDKEVNNMLRKMTNNYHPLQIGNYNYRFEMGNFKAGQTMNTKNSNDNIDGYDCLLESIKGIAEQIQGLADMAVVDYTPLVNDICRRKATQNEVELLLDYMFSFLGNERMLQLFKHVCHHYFYAYPV